MTNAETLKDALRQIHFRSDFNIGGVWDEALDGLIAEIEQAKRDALPCQVLDVLDSNRKLERSLTVQVNYATELEKENNAWEARVAGLEAHIETLNGWRETDLDAATNHIETIQGLQSGLREVYALAGEDPRLSEIINTTLERYPFP